MESRKIMRTGKQPAQYRYDGADYFARSKHGNWTRLDPAYPEHSRALSDAKRAFGLSRYNADDAARTIASALGKPENHPGTARLAGDLAGGGK